VGRDFALSVVADVQKFQRELATLPGFTDKQAAAMSRKLGGHLIKAQEQAAREAKKAASSSASAWSKAFGNVTFAFTTSDVKAAIGAVTSLAQRTADLRNQLTDASARTGVAAKTLGGLRLAFEGAGIEASALDSALNPLPKRLDDARKGTGEAVLAMERLGISQEALNGPLKDNDAAFQEVIRRMQAVEDPADRAAIAVGIFGEAGGKMLQAFGSADLETFVDQAERFGVGVGPEAAASASQWQRATADLSLVMQGITADLTDFLNVGQKLDNFTLGLLYVTESAKAFVGVIKDNLVVAAAALQAALAGNFVEMTRLQGQLRTEDGAWEEIARRVDDSAAAFVKNRKAQREGAKVSAELAAAVRTTSGEHETGAQKATAYAAAQREAEKAERAREAVVKQQITVLQQIAKLNNEAGADLISDQDKIIQGYQQQLVELQTLAESEQQQAHVREAAAQAMIAVRARMHREFERLQLEDLEVVEDVQTQVVTAAEIASAAYLEKWQTTIDAVGRFQEFGLEIAASLAGSLGSIFDSVEERYARQAEVAQASLEKQREAFRASRESMTLAERQAAKEGLKLEREKLIEIERKQKRAALASFRVQQASSIASAVVSGALLALTLNAPPPVGIGFPAGTIAATAMTGASVAAIAAQPPPKLHGGGPVQPMGMAPDERPVVGKAGEFMVSSGPAVRHRRELEELNRTGRMPGSSVTVVVGGRQLTDVLVDEAGKPGRYGSLFRDPSPRLRDAFR